MGRGGKKPNKSEKFEGSVCAPVDELKGGKHLLNLLVHVSVLLCEEATLRGRAHLRQGAL